jgi:hypothetical protein
LYTIQTAKDNLIFLLFQDCRIVEFSTTENLKLRLKLISDGGDSGSKKYNRSYGGVWRSLRLVGVWSLSQAVGFVLMRFTGIQLQSLT